jgi:site-specific recombinase XerD
LTELGIAPAVVQGLLGHAKLSTTFAHYTKPAQQKVLVAGMKDAEQKLELDAQQASA